MTKRSVLISGASIAGPALAYWLTRHGLDVVVVERAAELRTGGQTVDVRGAGRKVIQQMGLEDQVRARSTHEDGIAFVDEQNRTRAAIAATAFGGEGPVAELEILRGELARLLVERTQGDAEYRFGDRIAGVVDDGAKVHVRFLHGADQTFDLVIAADGINSRTRNLVFADEVKIRSFGLYTGYFTIPRAASDGNWARWCNAPGSRTIMLRPDNLGTTRASMSFQGAPQGYEKLDPAGQKEILRREFAGFGWEAPRVLAAMESCPDFYFEAIGQVKMPRWSKGRVALVGDAGYCASPISGMGTSLALVGAYVLAGELMRHDDHLQAFAAYEAILRPYVAQAQGVPSFAPRLASPRSRAGIAVGYTVLRFATATLVKRLLGKLLTPGADAIELPDYPSAPVTASVPAG